MSDQEKPESLIERAERETGVRIDYDDSNNNAMAVLIGAIAREMGKTPSTYRKSDDFVVGKMIQHQMSPEYERQKKRDEMLAEMLRSGLSPDDLAGMLGSRRDGR